MLPHNDGFLLATAIFIQFILNSSIHVYYSSISRRTHFMLLALDKAGELIRNRGSCDERESRKRLVSSSSVYHQRQTTRSIEESGSRDTAKVVNQEWSQEGQTQAEHE